MARASDILKQLKAHPAYIEGLAEAEQQVEAGKLGLKQCGKAAHWWQVAAQLFQDDFGIDLQVTEGSIVQLAIAANEAGYNERMQSAIAERFGPNVVESVWKRAEKIRKKARR